MNEFWMFVGRVTNLTGYVSCKGFPVTKTFHYFTTNNIFFKRPPMKETKALFYHTLKLAKYCLIYVLVIYVFTRTSF
jgi:hypothetical protein